MKEAAYDYLKLLEEHDHTRRCEYPPSFDLKAAEERFAHLAEELIAAYPGSTFETGAAIQDASFHGQIFLAFEGLTILIRLMSGKPHGVELPCGFFFARLARAGA